jgi:hypothetical protein
MPCPGICARRRPRRSAMPALMMPSGSAVTRYRMSDEPRRALQDTATASVRNARRLSRAAVHMSVPRSAVHMSVPQSAVHLSVPRNAMHMSVPRNAMHMSVPPTTVKMSVPPTAAKMSVPRSAARMSAVPARATTATIATIIAASTSSPSSEGSSDAMERKQSECRAIACAPHPFESLRPAEVPKRTRRKSTSGESPFVPAALSEWALPTGSTPSATNFHRADDCG